MVVGLVFFFLLLRGKGPAYPIHTGDAWVDQQEAPEPKKTGAKKKKKRKK